MAWTTRASRTVYENRWIHVREDEVTGPHGDGIYGVVRMQHPAVFVVALDDDKRVCFVELERYTTGRSLEIPAGGSDGEDPLPTPNSGPRDLGSDLADLDGMSRLRPRSQVVVGCRAGFWSVR